MFWFVLMWFIYGFCGYALSFGYWQNKPEWKNIRGMNHNSDFIFSVIIGCLGPFGFIIAFICSGFGRYGFKLK